MKKPPLKQSSLRFLFLASMVLGFAASAWAHGERVSLEFYGNFQNAARCQRLVSRASRLCYEQAASVRLRCAQAALFGRPCDEAELDGFLDTVTQQAREAIALGCSQTDLVVVGYLDLPDVFADVTRTCKDEAVASTSLIYGPAMFTGEVKRGPHRRDRCLRAASRFSLKVARAALRHRSRALDRIGSGAYTMEEKLDFLATAESRVSRIEEAARNVITMICSPEEFIGSYGMSQEDYFSRLNARADCMVGASHVQSAIQCPPAVCGNSVKEPGEECDDGNESDDDACTKTCLRTDCDVFASTFDLIQSAIFVKKGCTSLTCHDSVSHQGGLDLTEGNSYANLVGVPSDRNPDYQRVKIGDRDASMLYLKLAAATYPGSQDEALVGTPMPSGFPPLTEDELEAVHSWIRNGAQETGVIDGTADLLDACLPAADPLQIDPPEPPPAGEGVQIAMPPNPMPPRSETEVCFASYYDLSDVVPAESRGNYTCVGGNIGQRCTPGDPSSCGQGGTCTETFRLRKRTEVQDPLSHHLIINLYMGQYDVDDPDWGEWTCKEGQHDGETCDPKDPTFCGDGVCGSAPTRSIACIGFGPPDFSQLTTPAIGGSQESVVSSNYPEGVYQELPIKGIILWNSHAFNLTDRPAGVHAWMNMLFAGADDQLYPVEGGLENVNQIFKMNEGGGVPAFKTKEVCENLVFERGTRLFELSSHMHKRGKLFRYWNPQGELIYQTTQYNDPVQLIFDPPWVLDSADPAERTFKYCAVYDNGATKPSEVKRRSTSPPPPPPASSARCIPTHCAEGRVGEPCGGTNDHATCDTSPGAGDGMCDACRLFGGFTTEDEMFLPIAFYYVIR